MDQRAEQHALVLVKSVRRGFGEVSRRLVESLQFFFFLCCQEKNQKTIKATRWETKADESIGTSVCNRSDQQWLLQKALRYLKSHTFENCAQKHSQREPDVAESLWIQSYTKSVAAR